MSTVRIKASGKVPLKSHKVQHGYRKITPEVAAAYLKRSKRKNVPVKPRKIAQYASDMRRGKWDKYNSQAITIDWNGDIVNGHQRLMACVEAGVSFETMFVVGVPPESFTTEDTGRTRDAAHYFALQGEKHYTYLAAGARALYAWEQGIWRRAATTSGGGNVFIAHDDLLDELEHRPELRAGAAFYSKHDKTMRGRFKAGMIVALHALTQGHSAHDEFWKELGERLSVDPKSPPYALQRRIDQVKARGANLSGLHTLALLTKAWNFYADDSWKELLWDITKEPMPQPTTNLKPRLLPPEGVDNSPKEKIIRKVKAKPSANGQHTPAKKKGPTLRGGIGNAPAAK